MALDYLKVNLSSLVCIHPCEDGMCDAEEWLEQWQGGGPSSCYQELDPS